MGVDYFYRPIYTTASDWLFRIYKVYRDVTHFYFDKPHHYKSYKGGHYRAHHGNISFYKNNRKDHYKHDFYQGDIHARKDKVAPKMDARQAPNRKEVKREAQPNRRKEVRKESQPNRQKEARKEVKKDNKSRNGASTRSSQRENQEGRRAKR